MGSKAIGLDTKDVDTASGPESFIKLEKNADWLIRVTTGLPNRGALRRTSIFMLLAQRLAETVANQEAGSGSGSSAAPLPVLALWGEHDAVTPEALAVDIARGVQNGRVERIAGAAHLAPAEQAEAVAREILRTVTGE